MFTKSIILTALIAYSEARFGQEQVPIAAISAVKGGTSGEAQTIAGAAISDLLGGANACAKLSRADQIVSELGNGADAIAAAIGMVTAEKNTNPFTNGNAQNVCADASLPATPELRGITPKIDPAVNGSAGVIALSAQTAKAPLDATGKSVFDLLNDAGFGGSVVAQNAAGGAAAPAGNANAGNANANQAASNQTQAAGNDDEDDDCNAAPAATNTQAAGNDNAQPAAAATATPAAAPAAGAKSTVAGADFGKCTPTIIFEGGLGGRPATEFTFQIADKLARGGQEEALNPNIITNALCNQLTNVCGANAVAKSTCLAAKAKVAALGTRNKSTADAFNAAVGFAGAVTNPDGGPDDVPAGASTAGRRAVEFSA